MVLETETKLNTDHYLQERTSLHYPLITVEQEKT